MSFVELKEIINDCKIHDQLSVYALIEFVRFGKRATVPCSESAFTSPRVEMDDTENLPNYVLPLIRKRFSHMPRLISDKPGNWEYRLSCH